MASGPFHDECYLVEPLWRMVLIEVSQDIDHEEVLCHHTEGRERLFAATSVVESLVRAQAIRRIELLTIIAAADGVLPWSRNSMFAVLQWALELFILTNVLSSDGKKCFQQ